MAIVLMAAVLIAGVWGMMSREIAHHRHDVGEAARRDAGNLARAMEDHVLRTVTDIDRALVLLRADWLDGKERFLKTARLAQGAAGDDLLVQIGVIGADGMLALSDLQDAAQPVDLSDREHFRVHRDATEDRLFISKPVLGRVSGKWSIQFTRRIVDARGAFAGVLVLSVDPDYFSKRFGEIDLGAKGTVSLVGFDRVIRARGGGLPVRGGPELGMEIDWPVPAGQRRLPAGVFSAPGPVDGLPRLFAYRRVGDYPLVVAIGLAEDEVFAAVEAWEAGHRLWAYGITFVIVLGAAALMRSRRREAGYRAELEREARHLAESKHCLEHANHELKMMVEDLRQRDERLLFVNSSLRLLNGIAALPATSIGEKLTAALKLGCGHLGLELGILSRVIDQDYHFEHCCAPPGHPLNDNGLFELGKTYCHITLGAKDVVAIAHMATSEHRGHPCYAAFQLESYIGVPLIVQGEVYGTVNFSSVRPSERAFDSGDIEFMRLLGRWAGTVIAEERTSGELRRLATTDPLTGVWNRRHFIEAGQREVERARRYGRPLTLMILDVDHFKRVNDTFGHGAGDEALTALVAACRGVLRDSDLFGRFGGEEFVVLLPETAAAGALEVAERLRAAVCAIAIPRPEGVLRYTISAGVAELAAADSLQQVLQRADATLYAAKQAGRNRCRLAEPAPPVVC